ncbi:MAG: hypothetical protein ACRD3N_08140 [Terracidiphilus sp.]
MVGQVIGSRQAQAATGYGGQVQARSGMTFRLSSRAVLRVGTTATRLWRVVTWTAPMSPLTTATGWPRKRSWTAGAAPPYIGGGGSR